MNSSHIFIPFNKLNKIGGPITFMTNLLRYLKETEYRFSTNHKKACGIFFPITYKLNELKKIKQAGGFIIQRLDGIYYPSQHGPDFEELNRDIKTIYNQYADFVVFQSQYSRSQCFEMLGTKKENEYCIIHNGVYKDTFSCAQNPKKELTGTIRLVTTGNFRKRLMLEPIVLALDVLRERYNIQLHVVGPVSLPGLKKEFTRDYVHYEGKKNSRQLAQILQKADIFIHTQINDNCPNSVLEALSCGLPVVGFDSGAMKELLYFSRELLAPVSDEIFQKYEDYDYQKLAEKISLSIEQYADFKKRALENAGLFSFEECGRKYIEVFEMVKKSFQS